MLVVDESNDFHIRRKIPLVGCQGRDERGRFTIAAKLTIPDLEIVDQIQADVPESGNRTTVTVGSFVVDKNTGELTCYSLAHVFDGEFQRNLLSGTEKGNRPGPRRYLMAVDVQNQKPTTYALVDDGFQSLGQGQFLTSPDGLVGYVTSAFLGQALQDGKPPTRRFFLYLLKDRYDDHPVKLDIGAEAAKLSPQDAAALQISTASLLSNSQLLIALYGTREVRPRR